MIIIIIIIIVKPMQFGFILVKVVIQIVRVMCVKQSHFRAISPLENIGAFSLSQKYC